MNRAVGSVVLSVATLTLAARMVGFGRSVVFSKTVGDTCLGDVYNAANSLPNTLFEIVAGGVLAGVVIPVVARHTGAGRTREAGQTVSALLCWTLLVLTPAGVAALVGARLYAEVFAKADCGGSAATLAALLVMFTPQIWLYGLAVVSAGVLQAHHRFIAAAAAPLLSSVVVVAAYLGFAALAGPTHGADLTATTTSALQVLGWGTTAGVLVLALGTVFPLGRLRLRLRPSLRFATGDRKVILSIAAAGVAGLVLQQLSVQLISYSAQQTADPGALTRFTWANAVYLLPYAVLAAPLLQLIFPRLSAAAERGADDVTEVLRELGPLMVALAWLGAALLVATAVPVARVFVLGPGSGRTAGLSGPIAAFAPAVVGFSLLGLASRALLAQHQARRSGLATVLGWATVIVGVLVVRLLVPDRWLVTALAGSVSVGMLVGAAVGWGLLRRSLTGPTGLVRPLLAGLAAAAPAAGAGALLGRQLDQVGIMVAVLGAAGLALLATGLYVLVLRLLQPQLVTQLWELRRRPAAPVEEESS